MNTTQEKDAFWLTYPIWILVLGITLFYTQITFGWWTPNTFKSTILSSISLITLSSLAYGLIKLLKSIYLQTKEEWGEEGESTRLKNYIFLALLFVFVLMIISGLKPTHRPNEGDVLEYHMFLPTQAWLKGNWSPVEWHFMEFLLIPVDYALSPYWISFPLISRLPQVLIQSYLFCLIILFFKVFTKKSPIKLGLFTLLIFLGFRSVSIQIGFAMLDLVNLYLIISVFYVWLNFNSFNSKKLFSFIFGTLVAAYIGHKSFGIFLLFLFVTSTEFFIRLIYKKSFIFPLKKINWILFIIPFLLFIGPSLYRTFTHTGDPFFPSLYKVLPMNCEQNKLKMRSCEINKKIAHQQFKSVHDNTWGYNLEGFIKGFFLLALPTHPISKEGIFFGRNKLDYPVGIYWYLIWIFWWIALFYFPGTRRETLLLGGISTLYYLYWFATSQQGRWLYPVLILQSAHVSWVLFSNSKIKSSVQNGITIIILFGVFFTAARIPASQKTTLFCFGENCLKTSPELYSDYSEHCVNKEVTAKPGRNHLAYSKCVIENSFTEIESMFRP